MLQARKRLIDSGKPNWSLAILVPTKKMTRLVSDVLREPFGQVPSIGHTAAVDMDGPILAAEIVAFLLQQGRHAGHFDEFLDLLCSYYHGRSGAAPTAGDLTEAARLNAALGKWNLCLAEGKAPPNNSVLNAIAVVYATALDVGLTGDPDGDWAAIRAALEVDGCARLQAVAETFATCACSNAAPSFGRAYLKIGEIPAAISMPLLSRGNPSCRGISPQRTSRKPAWWS